MSNDLVNKITAALCELRDASKSAVGNPKKIMDKYDMLFIGEKFNVITGIEFRRTLKNYFAIDIEIAQLNEMIPPVCEQLRMTYELMVSLEDSSIEMYIITLW